MCKHTIENNPNLYIKKPYTSLMHAKELTHLAAAAIIFAAVIYVPQAIEGNWAYISLALLFAIIILGVNVLSKKIMARSFDTDLEHEVWQWTRFGFKPGQKTASPVPMGVILPLVVSALTLGKTKAMTLLTYETTAHPSGKRKISGYVFSEITDWHIALFGATGLVATVVLSFLAYFIFPSQDLWRYAAFYAFWNCIPFSKLDGAQILYGSKVLWSAMMIITTIVAVYGVILA